MDNYKVLKLGKFDIYISYINGNQIILPSKLNLTKTELINLFNKNNFRTEIQAPSTFYLNDMFKTVYICLHISNQCNMSCTYCFAKHRTTTTISLEDAKIFINMIILKFPNAHKFIVDPTGSGEPLMRMDFLMALAEFCHKKSNEIRKEVLPMLVTNGLLLNRHNVEHLQSSGYIFGVSIDGYKNFHDRNRVTQHNEGTYNRIIKNIKNIKHREYLGAAVTLSNSKMDLVKTFKNLYKYFTTISIKPVRSFSNMIIGINESNIDQIKTQYSKLYRFILDKTLRGNLSYLQVLLNGDDYFGKFILRVFLNQKINTRCDAGLGRFSLTPDKKIIACPGSIGIDKLVIGSLKQGISNKKTQELWKILTSNEKCENCEARFVCGGECLVVSYYKNQRLDSIDFVMCELKRYLFELSVKFKFQVYINNRVLFNNIYNGCKIKRDRFFEDKELNQLMNNPNNTYTFMKLKNIKDNDHKKFLKIKEKLK